MSDAFGGFDYPEDVASDLAAQEERSKKYDADGYALVSSRTWKHVSREIEEAIAREQASFLRNQMEPLEARGAIKSLYRLVENLQGRYQRHIERMAEEAEGDDDVERESE